MDSNNNKKILNKSNNKSNLSKVAEDYFDIFPKNKPSCNSNIFYQYGKIISKEENIKTKNVKENKNKSKNLKKTGGGKDNNSWKMISQNFFNNNNNSVTAKISRMSDSYSFDNNSTARYAGIIFWLEDDNMYSSDPAIRMIAPYVLIQDTNKWDSESFSRAGHGFVHDHLYYILQNESMANGKICTSGFSITCSDKGDYYVKYSSRWLNLLQNKTHCINVGNKSMNIGEIFILNEIINKWLESGPGSTVEIYEKDKFYLSHIMDEDSYCDIQDIYHDGNGAYIYP
jgi:hypothetical protein